MKKEPLRNVIEDPLLHPYHIKINDAKNYSIFREGVKEPLSHHTSIISALEKISLFKNDNESTKDTRTLKGYMDEYYSRLEEFRQTIKF